MSHGTCRHCGHDGRPLDADRLCAFCRRTPTVADQSEKRVCIFDVWINVHDGYHIPGGHAPHITEDVARRERCDHESCTPTHYLPEAVVKQQEEAAEHRGAARERERIVAYIREFGALALGRVLADEIEKQGGDRG